MAETIRTVLGFDFGLKRIGVAVGQTVTATANPLIVLQAQNGAPRWEKIEQLLQEWRPQALVVGMPKHLDGTEHEISQAARRFGNRLHGRFKLPVYWIDERLSSFEAEHAMRTDSGLHRNAQLDSMAAKMILESWLQNEYPRIGQENAQG